MKLLKFENIQVSLKHYIETSPGFAFDFQLDLSVITEQFLPLYYDYGKKNTKLNFFIDDKSYSGSFGQFIYDTEGNCRLWISTEEIDGPINPRKIYSSDITYYNLVDVITNQEIKINTLLEILSKKEIISDEDLTKFKNVLTPTDLGFNMKIQVKNLNEYLEKNNETLIAIENEDNY